MFECYIWGRIFPAKNLGFKDTMVAYWHEKQKKKNALEIWIFFWWTLWKTKKLSLKDARISAGEHSCIYYSSSVEQFI